jgi:hypothetical protein
VGKQWKCLFDETCGAHTMFGPVQVLTEQQYNCL